MIIELIIVFELIAFIFLGWGLFPFNKTVDDEGSETSTPFLNKIVYIGVAAIIFFILAVSTVSYDYTYCYVNETTADYTLNMSTSDATCADYNIESLDLSYLNMFLGILSLLLVVVMILLAAFTKRTVGSF